MEWNLVDDQADGVWAAPQANADAEANVGADAAEDAQRRPRQTEEQRKRSQLLSWLLRHAPNKYPDLKAQQHHGGYFPVDGRYFTSMTPSHASFSTFSDASCSATHPVLHLNRCSQVDGQVHQGATVGHG